MGIKSELFLTCFEDWWICLFCRDVLEDPVVTESYLYHVGDRMVCRHLFCHQCVQTHWNDLTDITCLAYNEIVTWQHNPPKLFLKPMSEKWPFQHQEYMSLVVKCD